MVRFCGAAFGFLAFSITITLGLLCGNPVEVTLQRAIRALLVFCALGLLLGWIGYRIVDEHALRRKAELFRDEPGTPAGPPGGEPAPTLRVVPAPPQSPAR